MLRMDTGSTSTHAKYWKKSLPAYSESLEATNWKLKNNSLLTAIVADLATTEAKKPVTTAKKKKEKQKEKPKETSTK